MVRPHDENFMKYFISAKPRAKKEQVIQIDVAHFKIFVKEPPVGGKANEAILKVFADYLGVVASRIRLVSGHTSKNKIIEVN